MTVGGFIFACYTHFYSIWASAAEEGASFVGIAFGVQFGWAYSWFRVGLGCALGLMTVVFGLGVLDCLLAACSSAE